MTTLSIQEYHKKWYQANKDRLREQRRDSRKAYSDTHKEEAAAYHIKRAYGLTPIEYGAILSKGCGICGTMDNLHIDHDHSCCPTAKTCGKCIRGALCSNHNKALGLFRDDIETLKAAILYLGPPGAGRGLT